MCVFAGLAKGCLATCRSACEGNDPRGPQTEHNYGSQLAGWFGMSQRADEHPSRSLRLARGRPHQPLLHRLPPHVPRKATGTDVSKFRLIFAGKVLSMWDTLWDSGIIENDSTINMHYRTLGGAGGGGVQKPHLKQHQKATANAMAAARSDEDPKQALRRAATDAAEAVATAMETCKVMESVSKQVADVIKSKSGKWIETTLQDLSADVLMETLEILTASNNAGHKMSELSKQQMSQSSCSRDATADRRSRAPSSSTCHDVCAIGAVSRKAWPIVHVGAHALAVTAQAGCSPEPVDTVWLITSRR